MSRVAILGLAAAVALCVPRPTPAQHQPASFAQWSPDLPFAADTSPRPASPDYRWEGFGIGAVMVGVLGAAVTHSMCAYYGDEPASNCGLRAIGGGLMGAVVGGVAGGLIGGLIPKTPRPTPTTQ